MTAGDPARRTGGNLYNRHMLAALRRDGVRVTTVVLRDRRLELATSLLGELILTELITHRIPFARAAQAYALLDDRAAETVQVVLDYA